MPSDQFRIRVEPSIQAIPADQWDRCANPADDAGAVETRPYNPFVSHAFLSALEASGSATRRTGWQPCHLVVEGETPLGVMPCYVNSHSQGEYVFDNGGADAYERAGGSYYPKLQVSVPFTPATGPRLLVRPDAPEARQALALGAAELAQRSGASSVHATFLPEEEWRLLGTLGYLHRTDQQFHWMNAGYATFDDFLETRTTCFGGL